MASADFIVPKYSDSVTFVPEDVRPTLVAPYVTFALELFQAETSVSSAACTVTGFAQISGGTRFIHLDVIDTITISGTTLLGYVKTRSSSGLIPAMARPSTDLRWPCIMAFTGEGTMYILGSVALDTSGNLTINGPFDVYSGVKLPQQFTARYAGPL